MWKSWVASCFAHFDLIIGTIITTNFHKKTAKLFHHGDRGACMRVCVCANIAPAGLRWRWRKRYRSQRCRWRWRFHRGPQWLSHKWLEQLPDTCFHYWPKTTTRNDQSFSSDLILFFFFFLNHCSLTFPPLFKINLLRRSCTTDCRLHGNVV